jgi:hypothetical protein
MPLRLKMRFDVAIRRDFSPPNAESAPAGRRVAAFHGQRRPCPTVPNRTGFPINGFKLVRHHKSDRPLGIVLENPIGASSRSNTTLAGLVGPASVFAAKEYEMALRSSGFRIR